MNEYSRSFVVIFMILSACSVPMEFKSDFDPYGGQDAVYIDLPFGPGYVSQCVQGVAGEYSHMLDCTLYDIDMDTPNYQDDIVFAPAGGTVYVHDDSTSTGFGLHINLDLLDNTYIVLAHLNYVFVEDGEEVAKGQILGFEGTTGYSTGDHLHMGRHMGDAELDASFGTSIMGLGLDMYNVSTDEYEKVLTYEMQCDLAVGHRYMSELEVALWHPDGALLTTPYDWKIYRKEHGKLRPFHSEEDMWDAGQNYTHVLLVSEYEMECYEAGDQIKDEIVHAGVDGDDVWLVIENRVKGTKDRWLVPAQAWKQVLYSWGVYAESLDELRSKGVALNEYKASVYSAKFRDGTLLKETGKSDVYVVSNTIAIPIKDWETYLLIGLWDQEIITVDPGIIETVQGSVGSCLHGEYCITRDVALTCGFEFNELQVTEEEDVEDEDDVQEEDEDDPSNDTDEPESKTSELQVEWISPSNDVYESIVLSGEYIQSDGVSSGWKEWGEELDDSSVIVSLPDTAEGDTFRFSVEFRAGSSVSWSCLGPYPPGTVLGTSSASWDGHNVDISVIPAPGSGGCELFLSVE